MNIDTLIPDIYELVKRKDGWFNEELAQSLSTSIAGRLQRSLGENTHRPTLRLSQMGPRCPRALWYSVHHPELAEPLPPWAEIKYSYGHILEALVIVLAKAAGHSVEGEQDEIVFDGIVGHRDCVIDGMVIDVKSASSRSFTKFKNKSIAEADSFGYLDQLDGYVLGSASDDLVQVKDKGGLLAVDKQLGHLCLYTHEVSHDRARVLRERIRAYKDTVDQASPPPCECKHVPDGSSGNLRLDLRASYSPYKFECNPRIRTFLYSSGPVYLTRVNRRPWNQYGPIPEIDRHGNKVAL